MMLSLIENKFRRANSLLCKNNQSVYSIESAEKLWMYEKFSKSSKLWRDLMRQSATYPSKFSPFRQGNTSIKVAQIV